MSLQQIEKDELTEEERNEYYKLSYELMRGATQEELRARELERMSFYWKNKDYYDRIQMEDARGTTDKDRLKYMRAIAGTNK